MSDKLIFGKNTDKNIVNISYRDDGYIDIYYANGIFTEKKTINHRAFVFTAYSYEGSTELTGPGYYRYVTPVYDTPYEKLYGNDIYKPRSIEEGFMVLNGYTYYKGMKVNEVSLLSTDIETTTKDPTDENAEVTLISNTFRDRYGNYQKKLFSIFEYNNQNEMIRDWCSWVRKVDPDIILGHYFFGFDLPYMDAQEPLMIGRDGSRIQFSTKTSKKRKDQQQAYDYKDARINGRDIICTMFLSLTYDALRKFPSYGLKKIEKHLKLVGDDRIEWDFNMWPPDQYRTWPAEIWNNFCEYCRDDGDSPIKLFDIMAPSYFYLTQSIPKKFQQIINEATGSQIDSFLIRSYAQDGLALPKSDYKGDIEMEGAISMGVPGVYKNVKKVDVASLYPSIMLNYNIYPESKDYKKNFLTALEYFTNERLKNKKIGKETGDPYYIGLDGAQKIVINSMFGFMGTNYLLFNKFEKANLIMKKGREILLKGVEWATGHTLEHVVSKIVNKGKENERKEYEWVVGRKVCEGKGYSLVNVDTDSFSYTNGEIINDRDFNSEIEELNSLYPSLIRWEWDGIYEKLIVIKAKNYVMKEQGCSNIIYKGSSLKDQKKEPILKAMLNEMLEVMLNA